MSKGYETICKRVWRISLLRWMLLTAALGKSPLGLSSCLIEAELWQNECAQCGLCPPVGHLQSFINAAVVVHAHLHKTTHHKHKKSKPRRCRAPLLPLSPCSEHDSCRLEMRLTLNAQRSLPLYEVLSLMCCLVYHCTALPHQQSACATFNSFRPETGGENTWQAVDLRWPGRDMFCCIWQADLSS